MNLEKKILDKLLKTLNDEYQNLYHRHLRPEERKIVQKENQQMLKNKKIYKSYEVSHQDLKKIVLAYLVRPFGTEYYVSVKKYYFDSEIIEAERIKNELNWIAEFFQHQFKLRMNINREEKKLRNIIRKNDFKIMGTRLVAPVDLSISKLQRFQMNGHQYDLSVMKFKKDIDDVLNLELIVHKNDPTSVLNSSISISQLESYKKTLRQLSRLKTVYLLRDQGELIGSIAFRPEGYKLAHISSISVHPKYQGKGLSKRLYFEAVEKMSKSGIKYYLGFSNTDFVLNQAKKLGRKPYADVWISPN